MRRSSHALAQVSGWLMYRLSTRQVSTEVSSLCQNGLSCCGRGYSAARTQVKDVSRKLCFKMLVTYPNRTDPGVVDMCGLYSCAQMATYEPVFFSVLEA